MSDTNVKPRVIDNLDTITAEKEEGFAPTQVLLPSVGKIYSSESPLHKKDFIEIKELTAKEEDILTSRILIKKGLVLDKLIESCIVDKRIKADDLILGDRNTILLALRVSGYGPEYQVSIKCEQCDNSQTETFDLNKINVKTLDIDPVIPDTALFDFTLPKSRKTVRFKLFTVKDQNELTDYQLKIKKLYSTDVERNITARLAKQIVSIDSNEDRKTIVDFVNNMPISDSRALREYIAEITPDIEMKGSFTCASCGESAEIDIPLTTEFFWPSGKR